MSPQPPQHQEQQPGVESQMTPRPKAERPEYQGSAKLKNKVAIITGGDSGIGRAIAIAFAKEGANKTICYLNEKNDAEQTKQRVEELGARCLLVAGDISDKKLCLEIVAQTLNTFGNINILVNNAAEQHPTENIQEISEQQLEKTFRTNIFSYFFMVQAVLPHLASGSCIINTTSVTAYKGSHHLLDYSATKGAIVTFTRSLAINLIKQGIRVNGVAPGPIWTPLIPASFSEQEVEKFGEQVPMERPGQPEEIAPSYVFLASDDASYMSGQVLHPNGGVVING
ncbi:MAG: 3-oxoacyl-(acyl-carrier-protein) reductase [Gammaproteobacteria bacterium]|nr:3-oxoacyl-(acyl-carrier-protein) reductase [Gammaproteobacteria bacterium]